MRLDCRAPNVTGRSSQAMKSDLSLTRSRQRAGRRTDRRDKLADALDEATETRQREANGLLTRLGAATAHAAATAKLLAQARQDVAATRCKSTSGIFRAGLRAGSCEHSPQSMRLLTPQMVSKRWSVYLGLLCCRSHFRSMTCDSPMTSRVASTPLENGRHNAGRNFLLAVGGQGAGITGYDTDEQFHNRAFWPGWCASRSGS